MVKAIRHLSTSVGFGTQIAGSGLCGEGRKNDWTTLVYECELITPMYGGGVEPRQVDEAMPIRETSIRGQLRFWCRLIYVTENVTETRQRERQLWGGIGQNAEEVFASKVAIQVKPLQSGNIENAAAPKPDRDGNLKMNWSGSLDGKEGVQYGLFSALGKCTTNGSHDDKNPVPGQIIRVCKWGLHVCVHGADEAQISQVKNTIRFGAALGGVGSRTRRGFGAVSVTLNGEPQTITTDEAKQFGCELVPVGIPFQKTSSLTQLNVLLERYKNFRQGVNTQDLGYGRHEQGEPATQRPAGRSRWPEADLLRRSTKTWFGKEKKARHFLKNQPVGIEHAHTPTYLGRPIYPRASFGLPIILHFMDPGEPPDISLEPNKRDADNVLFERMASPLIMKPMLLSDGRAQMHLLLLPTAAESISVRVKDVITSAEYAAPAIEKADAHIYDAWSRPLQTFASLTKGGNQQSRVAKSNNSPSDPTSKALSEPDCWDALEVRYERKNAISVRHSDGKRSATAVGDAKVEALLASLPEDDRLKLINRRKRTLIAWVLNGEIVKLEAGKS